MQGQQKGASLSCAAPDLTPDLDVGVGALSCFPQAGVAALGGWSGAQQVPRVCGGGHCNYFHKHLLSVFWALLFPAPWMPAPLLQARCLIPAGLYGSQQSRKWEPVPACLHPQLLTRSEEITDVKTGLQTEVWEG